MYLMLAATRFLFYQIFNLQIFENLQSDLKSLVCIFRKARTAMAEKYVHVECLGKLAWVTGAQFWQAPCP